MFKAYYMFNNCNTKLKLTNILKEIYLCNYRNNCRLVDVTRILYKEAGRKLAYRLMIKDKLKKKIKADLVKEVAEPFIYSWRKNIFKVTL